MTCALTPSYLQVGVELPPVGQLVLEPVDGHDQLRLGPQRGAERCHVRVHQSLLVLDAQLLQELHLERGRGELAGLAVVGEERR